MSENVDVNDKLDWNISKRFQQFKMGSGAQRNGNDLAGFEMAIKRMLKSLTDKKAVKNP